MVRPTRGVGSTDGGDEARFTAISGGEGSAGPARLIFVLVPVLRAGGDVFA
jgi:hypothetical protein